MLNLQTDLPRIKELLEKAQDVLIVTHEKPTYDSLGSALSLYLGLMGLGKKVSIAIPDAITVGLSSFVGVDKIKQEMTKKNFVISLDYTEGSIEKVSYNIEGDKFNLVVEPRPGFESFSQENVHYSYQGASADLIFAVDTIHLGGLKKLYEEEKDLYASKPVINIDRHGSNANYGQINVIDTSASSSAELVARVLSGLGVKLTVDIASNLLNAVYGATNNFQNANVTPSAFELAAVCMKGGGKRFGMSGKGEEQGEQEGQEGKVGPQIQPAAALAPRVSTVVTEAQKSVAVEAPYVGQQSAQAPAAPAAAQPQAMPIAGQGSVTMSSPQQPPTAPPDWLKPKIFKSSTQVS